MQKKYCPQNKLHFGYMKFHVFHGNSLYDGTNQGVHTKILLSQQQLTIEY